MKLEIQQPGKSLNKAYLKEKVSRDAIDAFKTNLKTLLSKIDSAESEEHHKYPITDFLKDTWYKDRYEINTKDRADFVIHNGKTTADTVGVIIEVKSPANQAEMITGAKPNKKAMHELVLYYLRERIDKNQTEIKRLIITNIWEWYIFDEAWFEKNIYQSKLRKDYENYIISGKNTKFFFDSIAQPFLEALHEPVPCTCFDFRNYEKTIHNSDKKEDNKLIALYKLLSPAHLLKQPFANDSNSLDTKFYAELLHIIGLEEVKDGSKKLIQRREKPDTASLLESAIMKLEDKDALRNITALSAYGNTRKDQLFNVALELCITWINRILFIKLLEGQLVTYHKNDKQYLFLNIRTIRDFNELNDLFFQVLAERANNRHHHLKEKFSKVPYLNSSLFDRTTLERQTIEIGALDNRLELPVAAATVLKNDLGRRSTGKLPTLQYLFDFLDAYDFSSDGGEEIQEENKNLINASVLGLIFEKINGYKDGSFFTPGFVTMYMCRETIRRAVLQKFNEAKGWQCGNIDELYGKIEDKKEANALINTLKICDPAVGSGHFLVSALNELIAIKSELKILLDRQGKALRDYNVEVVNDELVITDEEGKLLDYKPKSKESQRIQEALFHEKETIIENCLFGVDINPNSVKICRLRLWIELLKNAYYTTASDFTELETLPNIDINIKRGNSLISRFALDADLSKALKKSKWTIDTYRIAVQNYRNAESKEEKREMEDLIETIKTNFRTEIGINDPKLERKNKLAGELFNLLSQKQLFGETKAEIKARKQKQEKLETEITKLETQITDIKSNKIYENAFEWRFEFPEVLDNDGRFIGFDVVIGNPPYVQSRGGQFNEKEKDYFYTNYKTTEYQINTFGLFIEKGVLLLKEKGLLGLIIPNYWISTKYDRKLRKYIFQNNHVIEAINVYGVFEEAVVDTMILIGIKGEFYQKEPTCIKAINNKLRSIRDRLDAVKDSNWNFENELVINKDSDDVIISFQKEIRFVAEKKIGDYFILKFGAKLYEVGKGIPAQTKEFSKKGIYESNEKISDEYKKLLRARNVKHFYISWDNSWVKYGENLAAPRSREIFNGNRILLQRIVSRNNLDAAFINEEFICNTDVITLKPKNLEINCKLFVAIINSKLCSKYIRSTNVNLDREAFPKINTNTLESFPVPNYDHIDVEVKKAICVMVDKISELKISSQQENTDIYENEIDQLVYQLYGLTEEEIKIVEGNNIIN